ncbi:PA4780 family RIO1-like protein kinase [Spongiibacter marinus]|uniref:PA4780 family RIO1-like protein kinase n=1 Tax=Spongiibacter marinus TaxID=354246 RepID=UPI003C3B18DB
MKTPKALLPLIEDGIVDEVVSQLMSGKEATVYVVRCGNEIRCAKVYKDAAKRSFKKAVQYREGRKQRSSRRARAMEKGSSYGRKQQEEVWQNTEVDALYRLTRAGVRVPKPYGCFDGVLLMEVVCDESGHVAPRLNDFSMSPDQAREDHRDIMHDIMRMLCAGLVYGDLSEFNVLVDDYGPVIIDLPQAVDAAANNNAQSMLLRDVKNMNGYYGQYAPELLDSRYGEEIWALYEAGELHADTELSGSYIEPDEAADVDAVLEEIKAVMAEHEEATLRAQDQQESDY